MTNKLLRDAIADAKAVRETALAHAKAALEEAFTPHITSMLSARLRNEQKPSIRRKLKRIEATKRRRRETNERRKSKTNRSRRDQERLRGIGPHS